jgi:hypothetical protein
VSQPTSKDLLSTLRDYGRGGWVGSALADKAADEIERLDRELDVAADEIAKLTTERNVARAVVQPPLAASKLDFLDERAFYEVMQAYRHAYIVDQEYVSQRFEAVKAFIRERLSHEPKVCRCIKPKFYRDSTVCESCANPLPTQPPGVVPPAVPHSPRSWEDDYILVGQLLDTIEDCERCKVKFLNITRAAASRPTKEVRHD